IKTEELCVRAVLTRPKDVRPELDTILWQSSESVHSRNPKVLRLATGQIIERVILSHRLWKIVPFNFESYSGIRVNVPREKQSWKVAYPQYKPFKAVDERPFVPHSSMEDIEKFASFQLL
ncbi:Transient receptor putative cation channel subfamily M member 2, partial [Cichlidogyrus casuarinus]